jgi:L,D-peptidoglycan transpeptidase YkuD (ErfK/YbiS/YcfS/YnhG family)
MASVHTLQTTENAMLLLASSRQLLLVVAPSWNSCTARLRRFDRPGSAGDWQAVGRAVSVSLGRAGLAWGQGLQPIAGGDGAIKCEGDGRAPAGVFPITGLFGYAAADSPFARVAKMSYLCATNDLKAIDDPVSAHYNRIVDQSLVAQPDWTSCEDMLRTDQCYAVGAVVAHNAEPPVPGAGSCIFLHVWQGEGMPTAGCTAMSLADMTEIAGWLDASAAPLLVQLPRAEYEALRPAWALPPFSA